MDAEVVQSHIRFLWTRFVMVAVGIWLMVTPITFNAHSPLMSANDLVCGLAVIFLSFLALSPYRLWAPWSICAIGVWLQLAPLVFWAPNAVSYLNDTAAGSLLILLSLIIPGTPGGIEQEGAEIPPGWSYNPSAWGQRLPVILFAYLAWLAARYMAAYQLGYIDTIWDPFFDDGTRHVITSPLSKSFPISDAGLGAFVYTMEVLMGFKGRTRRWYTMPWIVLLFGVMVVPAGFVSILLIMLQPLIVGYWCTWCLLTALCMLFMIALAVDEVVAVCQYLAAVKKQKKPFWKIFWKGGGFQKGDLDTRSPALHEPFIKSFAGMFWGVTFPWNLVLSTLLGIGLMFTPTIVEFSGNLARSDYIVGALIVTLSVTAMAEVMRAVRFVNVLLGLWVFVFSFFSVHDGMWLIAYHLIMSIALVLLSLSKGRVVEQYGTWNKYIF